MEMLSDRIGVVKTDEDLTVYIKASTQADVKKLNLFKLWVILWSLAGIAIFSQLFFDFYSRMEKLYMVIYLAFWAYFEYRMIRAYYFRKYGIETIYINNDKFMVRRDILSKKGKPVYYRAEEKNPFHEVEETGMGLGKVYYSSFWIITGGSIGFGHSRGENRVGLQLPKADVKKLVKLMNSYIRVTSPARK